MKNETTTPLAKKTGATSVSTGKGSWNDQKVKLKAKFSTLKDSDLNYENGKKDEMMSKIQTKLGKTKEQLDTIISAL